ncbi:hypothetical protein ACFL59_07715 [Planctomycetota bacterium]
MSCHKPLLVVVAAVLLTGCSSFNIHVYNDAGQLVETHGTAVMWVGAGIPIADQVIDSVFLVGGLFFPFPSLETSDGSIVVGQSLPAFYQRLFGRFVPKMGLITGSSSTASVCFTSATGEQVTIVGRPFRIEQMNTFFKRSLR